MPSLRHSIPLVALVAACSGAPADTTATAAPVTESGGEAAPPDVSELFGGRIWATSDDGSFYLLVPELEQDQLTVAVSEDMMGNMYLGDDVSVVTIVGRTIRFDVLAYGEAAERVELTMRDDGITLAVVAWFDINGSVPSPRTLVAVDALQRLLWAQENDLGHNDGGASDSEYAFERLVHDATRAGVVRAGVDRFSIDISSAIDLVDVGLDSVTEQMRHDCNALDPDTCTTLTDTITQAVAAHLSQP